MKIAILTLTVQRDRDIDSILADKLRTLGHEVNVRNYIQGGREAICYEKPDVVICPMVGGQYKYDFVKMCKKWGCEVIVRRGEAGVVNRVFGGMSEERKDLIVGHWDYSPYVDLELVWGKGFATLLSTVGHMPLVNLRACGAFAFDPYFANGLPLVQRNRNRQKTILFATGFSTCDCRSQYCESGLPEDSVYHQEVYKVHRAARDKWIRTIKKLYVKYGVQWKFELKVRPGEMEDEYIKELGDEYRTIKIHPQKSSSSEVLRSVDLLIHSGSTMAIEAHLLGIPSFNFHNVNPDPMIAGVAPQVETYNELERLIGRVDLDKSNVNAPMLRSLEELLYGAIDGRACERAAGFIDAHLKGRKIETNIPDVWTKTTDYLEEGVHLEKQEGDVRWVCVCCRNCYYAAENVTICRCPFCSTQIQRTTVPPRVQPVLK